MSGYPQPHEDAVNAPLLAGWREGKVMIQRCGGCGKAIFYPKPMCPHCWSDKMGWFQASGRGKIVAWSLVHKPHHPAFDGEVPIVLVEVALDEGVVMLTRIVGADREKARTGAKVVAVPMPDAARYPLPTFKLA
jgi:uncharacterized protein